MVSWASMTDVLLVALGGAAGAVIRYALGLAIATRTGMLLPLHTGFINVSGSFAIGVVLTLIAQRVLPEPAARLLLVTGFLGGYTTFSTYSVEVLALLESGHALTALWYVLGSNLLSVAAACAGMLVARAIGGSA